MTSVVCIKVKNIRPKYDNLKKWMENKNNVYIGRKGVLIIDGQRFPKQDSIWANRFKIGKDGTRDEVIELYRKDLLNKFRMGNIKIKQLLELDGKTLGCWCKPEPCHGDVIIDLLNKLKKCISKYEKKYDNKMILNVINDM
jgi:hypothetical protein